ncbi:MAG TPA: class A beta-lactamase [Pyrinomonadaceae bacterium]|nr:class A beta-lactamase [Pyrinomonadaceae bacterium]
MKRALLTCLSLFIFLTSACASRSAPQNDNPAASPAESDQTAKTDDKRNDELQKQIEQIASAAKGRVGVGAVLLETGESVSLNPKAQFPMLSVYKLPIGMAVLHQVDTGKLKLEQKVRVQKSDFVSPGQRSPIRDKNPNGTESSVSELLQLMLSESDGTASDVLLRLAGGPEAVNKYLNELKISEIVVANTEKEFGRDRALQYRNWASPEGAVALLRALHERRGISEQNRALLLKFMIESPTGPKRLKGLLPASAIVAHKT